MHADKYDICNPVMDCFLANSQYKMILYSVHDTSVASLLLALGIFDDKWPDFAAEVVFELYRDKVTTHY